MSAEPDVTTVDQLEAKHTRAFDEEFDELGPAKACWFLTCLIASDSETE